MNETGRKVSLNHLAFYRAWLQGIDLRDAASLYLDPDIDLREAKTAIEWIRETLVRAARRHGKLGYARLLRIKIPSSDISEHAEEEACNKSVPSFDEFYEEKNQDGFYSEAELLELYLAEYPEAKSESSKEKKAKRLIERQLEAINWAVNHLSTPPMPSDNVVEWFDDPMAVKLILANLNTLQKLCDRIRAKGYRWWVGVRQVGEIQGGKITRWLAQHEDTLGSLGEHALSPIRSVQKEIKRVAETGIVPIEAFSPPSILDGSSGTNRLPGKSRIQANNDHQAIMAWLSARAPNEHTKRSYRREAERLLLWAILERGKALSSLNIEDGASYREWLAALGRTSKENWYWRIPQERWIGKRNTPRWSPEWRPFEGALSLNSQRQTYTILKSMFEWLVKVRYVDSNPFDGVSRPSHDTGDTAPHIEMGRAFTRGQWTFIMEYLDGLEMGDKVARLRFLLPFAYATGLRLSELADARTGRLYSKPMKDGLGVRWMLNVLGKGQKWRVVPMPSSVMSELGKYLAWRGLSEIPSENPPDTPLIAPLQDNKSRHLSHGMLYKILKSFFLEVAAELERRGHVEDAKNIAKASTHWLRHTRGSHSAEIMPLNLVQRLLGHASLTTTSIYTSVDEEALYEAMEQELKKTKSGV